MIRYVIVSIGSGVLFGMMDAFIHANPLAKKLFTAYEPVAKKSINAPAGLLIDLVYGFVTAGVFLVLYQSLPGSTGAVKGIGFGLMVWFFRVVMGAATSWMTLNVPVSKILYTLITGLVEMLCLGMLFGISFKEGIQ